MFLMIGHICHLETSVTEAHNRIFQPGLKQDHWSCFCLLEFPSLLPESSICTNPQAPDDNDFFDKLPMCVGRDRKMETANGKMSFPLQINVYEVYIWHLISSLGWGPSGQTLAEHVFCQLPGYLGWIGNMPFIWNAQSVWEREHNYI